PELELAKAQLSHKITTELAARKLTQRAAAALLGIDQPRVSLLVRGKTGQFSLEKLIEFLGRLGFDVRIEATHSPGASQGRALVWAGGSVAAIGGISQPPAKWAGPRRLRLAIAPSSNARSLTGSPALRALGRAVGYPWGEAAKTGCPTCSPQTAWTK